MKKFTLVDRIRLEDLLTHSAALNFKELGKVLGKDGTSISREIKKYLTEKPAYAPTGTENDCIYIKTCKEQVVCGDRCRFYKKIKNCRTCDLCVKNCKKHETICHKLLKPPFVCNGCLTRNTCRLLRRFYLGTEANKNASTIRSEARSCIALNKQGFYEEDLFLSKQLEKGQSIHHIYVNNKEKFNSNERTVYNRIHQGTYSTTILDLPTAAKRVKKQYITRTPKSADVLSGRTYADFVNYSLDKPHENVEMDTVIGRVGGKVLLTLQFVSTHLMLAFLLENKSSTSVFSTFYHIRRLLENANLSINDLMPIILTDNGTEFSRPQDLELNTSTGEYETKIFFCTPYRSCEKPHVENNHTLIRRILPSSTSFDDLTQDKINLMMSHINSYKRKSLMDKSPLELFELFHPGIAKLFGITFISSNEIILKNTLLK